MLYKRCVYCNERYQYNDVCGCRQQLIKSKRTYKKEKETSFYKSKDWLKARQKSLIKANHLDLFSLYHLKKIEPADTVHHIIELSECVGENKGLATHSSNLIPVTRSNHRYIHSMYERDKKGMQDILAWCLEEHRGVLKKYSKQA